MATKDFAIYFDGYDEISVGFGDMGCVTLNEDGSKSIEDNGRGIPTGIYSVGCYREKVSGTCFSICKLCQNN